MRYILLGSFIAILAACTTSDEIRMPDGRMGHAIQCNGLVQSWGSCMKRAGELCPRGYDIAMGNRDGGYVSGGGGSANVGPYGGSASYAHSSGPMILRELVIACK